MQKRVVHLVYSTHTALAYQVQDLIGATECVSLFEIAAEIGLDIHL